MALFLRSDLKKKKKKKIICLSNNYKKKKKKAVFQEQRSMPLRGVLD
jgi:hypothetical protein